MEKATTKPVYKQRLAGYLMQRGFVLVAMAPNVKNPNMNTFFFRDSPELNGAIQAYLNRK